jgi:stress response protein SCP2
MNKYTVTPEELQELRQLQNTTQRVVQELGEIALARLSLEDREENAKTFLKQHRLREQEFGKALSEKYGDGELNPETGEFTPIQK